MYVYCRYGRGVAWAVSGDKHLKRRVSAHHQRRPDVQKGRSCTQSGCIEVRHAGGGDHGWQGSALCQVTTHRKQSVASIPPAATCNPRGLPPLCLGAPPAPSLRAAPCDLCREGQGLGSHPRTPRCDGPSSVSPAYHSAAVPQPQARLWVRLWHPGWRQRAAACRNYRGPTSPLTVLGGARRRTSMCHTAFLPRQAPNQHRPDPSLGGGAPVALSCQQEGALRRPQGGGGNVQREWRGWSRLRQRERRGWSRLRPP